PCRTRTGWVSRRLSRSSTSGPSSAAPRRVSTMTAGSTRRAHRTASSIGLVECGSENSLEKKNWTKSSHPPSTQAVALKAASISRASRSPSGVRWPAWRAPVPLPAMRTSPSTRSGCSAATRTAHGAPRENPTRTERSTPASSMTATVSAATSEPRYAVAPAGLSPSALPRPSNVTTWRWRASAATWKRQMREGTIVQVGSSMTVGRWAAPYTAYGIRTPDRTTVPVRSGGRGRAGSVSLTSSGTRRGAVAEQDCRVPCMRCSAGPSCPVTERRSIRTVSSGSRRLTRAFLAADLHDAVEGRLGDAGEPGEPGGGSHVVDPCRARLGAQGETDVLRQRRRRAQQRGEPVVGTSHRVEVVLHPVAGHRLDDHPGPVRGEGAVHLFGGADRVAHVVEGVEHRDEVEATTGEGLGGRDLEAHAVRHSRRLRPLAGGRDRLEVVVVADEPRLRKGLSHQHRGGAVTAAD